jgi:WD40 repeat protein
MVSLHPGGRRFAVPAGSAVKVYNGLSGQVLQTFSVGKDTVVTTAFSKDGRYVAALSGPRAKDPNPWVDRPTIGWPRNIRVWELASGRELRPPDGWGLNGAQEPRLRMVTSACRAGVRFGSVAYSPTSNRQAAWPSGTDVLVGDLSAPDKDVVRLTGHKTAIEGVTFSLDGKRVAAVSADVVKVWDLVDHGREVEAPLGLAPFAGAAFGPNGEELAWHDQQTALIEETSFAPMQSQFHHGIWSRGSHGFRAGHLFDASGRRFLRIGSGVELSDLNSGQGVHITGDLHGGGCAAFTPDGSRLVTAGDDGVVRFWDTTNGEEVLTLRAHTGRVEGLALSPDGNLLATSGVDGLLRIWDGTPRR